MVASSAGCIAVPYCVAHILAHLQQRRVTAIEILDPDAVHVVEIVVHVVGIGRGVSAEPGWPRRPR